MKIAFQLDYRADFRRSVALIERMEAEGLDAVWVPEVWGHDAPTLLGYLAARTDSVTLGAGVLPVFSRTPALIAQTAAALDELTDGRAVVGLGTSGPQVIEGWHGVAFDRPITRLRETVAICRRVWSREPVAFAADVYRLPFTGDSGRGLGKPLRLMTHPLRTRIPIHLAVLGPAGVRLAAEVADGWLPLFFFPERAEAVWGRSLAAGTARRGGDLAALEISAGGVVAIGAGPEVAHARKVARSELARYVGVMGSRGANFYADLISRYGFADCASAVHDHYLSGRRADAEATIPDPLIEGLNLIGDDQHVLQRLAAHRAAGVTTLVIGPTTPDPLAAVRGLRALLDQ